MSRSKTHLQCPCIVLYCMFIDCAQTQNLNIPMHEMEQWKIEALLVCLSFEEVLLIRNKIKMTLKYFVI